MFTKKPGKSNALLAALLSMAQLVVPNSMKTKTKPKKKGPRLTKKSRSKANARHIQGEHFKPVHLFEVDGKPMPPSMYRRLHLGVQNPRKQNGSHANH